MNIKKFKKTVMKNKDLTRFSIFVALIFAGFLLGANKGIFFGLNWPTASNRVSSENAISAKKLRSTFDNKDFVFINVHTPYEGEIEKTDSFIEYDSIKSNEALLPESKSTPIVLYCKSGRMSAKALSTLKDMGYTNVRHLDGGMDDWQKRGFEILDLSGLPSQVLPVEGFELPIVWGDMGPRLIVLGVIDKEKFQNAVAMDDVQRTILFDGSEDKIKINSKNSQFVVDMLWAFGLAQKSIVYDKGPMGTDYKERAGNFASTGGWNLAQGNAMDYYNNFNLINLTSDQEQRVYNIAQNVYRPCCGNHTAFPDCNHGMAALAAIELMVHQGLTDEEIYINVLKLNSFWFPQNYLTTATYFARQGITWDKIDTKLVLGQEYSSGLGAQEVFKKVGPLPYEGEAGGSCGA